MLEELQLAEEPIGFTPKTMDSYAPDPESNNLENKVINDILVAYDASLQEALQPLELGLTPLCNPKFPPTWGSKGQTLNAPENNGSGYSTTTQDTQDKQDKHNICSNPKPPSGSKVKLDDGCVLGTVSPDPPVSKPVPSSQSEHMLAMMVRTITT